MQGLSYVLTMPIVRTPAISEPRATLTASAELPDSRSQNGLLNTASASSTSVTPPTTARVPNVEISQNPVANTPTMLPRVAAAWMRPTTRPVTSSELSESFTIIGVIVPSRTEGRKKRSAVSHRTCNSGPQVVGAAIESRLRERTSTSPEASALKK